MRTPNDKALLEWRRAALQEAQAIEHYTKGRLSLAALTVELRRAEQTRLSCQAFLPMPETQPVSTDSTPLLDFSP